MAIDFRNTCEYKLFLENLKENDLVIAEYQGINFFRQMYRNVLAIRDDRGLILLTDGSFFDGNGIGINATNSMLLKPEQCDIENFINRNIHSIKESCTDDSFLTNSPKLEPKYLERYQLLSRVSNFPFKYLGKDDLSKTANNLSKYQLEVEELTHGNISSEV